MQNPLVIAIVLNWNGIYIKYNEKSILETTLKTLSKVDYNNLKVIVVDASSEDSSIKFIKTNFKNFDILSLPNKGWAYANNRAMEYAIKKYPSLSYILLLNDDLKFNERKWLKKLVTAGEKHEDAGIIGCKLKYVNGRVCEAGTYTEKFYALINVHNKHKKNGYVGAVIGAVFLVKREVLEHAGLFDEIYLPFFKEETDFCERARSNGYYTYYICNTNITHLEGYSTTKVKIKRKWPKEYMEYIGIRNDWIFVLRWYKHLFLFNLVYDSIQAFIGIDPNFRFRSLKEVRSRLKFMWIGLIDAIKLYKKHKIPILHQNLQKSKDKAIK